jgi:hypothetical protein
MDGPGHDLTHWPAGSPGHALPASAVPTTQLSAPDASSAPENAKPSMAEGHAAARRKAETIGRENPAKASTGVSIAS